ncbi:MAG: DUF4190 domain-containing protein [Candidatus Microsaccharimonas sp.]
MNKPKALSIIGFCTSFIIAPLGMALSIVALFLNKKAKTGKEGLAIAGIVIGGVFTPFFFIVLLIASSIFSSGIHYENVKTSFQPVLASIEELDIDKVCETKEGLSESFSSSYVVWYTTDQGTGILDTIKTDLQSEDYIYNIGDNRSYSTYNADGSSYGAKEFKGEYSSELTLQYNNARFSVTVYDSGNTTVDCNGSYGKALTQIEGGRNIIKVSVY